MTKEVATKKDALPTVYEGFEEFGDLGFSEVTSEDLAIPFLRILQAMSPQKNKRDGAYVDGAEEGMFFNTSKVRSQNFKTVLISIFSSGE